MSLLNRPRLQAPSYDLPGMQESTTKVYEPKNRSSELADQALTAAAAVKAAFSPRLRGKLEEPKSLEDDRHPTKHVPHKGVIDDASGRVRRNGPYPSSPMITAPKMAAAGAAGAAGGSGARTPSQRTGSREAKFACGQAPLSARPKARQHDLELLESKARDQNAYRT